MKDNNALIAYFNKIIELKQSGIEYPVDLDNVWELVYDSKDDAINTLRTEFIENVDYQQGTYKLTVSCMEYFIIRKSKLAFEVYRLVFHKRLTETNRIDIGDILANPNKYIKMLEEYKAHVIS